MTLCLISNATFSAHHTAFDPFTADLFVSFQPLCSVDLVLMLHIQESESTSVWPILVKTLQCILTTDIFFPHKAFARKES